MPSVNEHEGAEPIEIPKEFRAAVSQLASLTDEQAERLIESLRTTDPAIRLIEYASDVAEKLKSPDWTATAVEQLIAAVLTASETSTDDDAADAASAIGQRAGLSLGLPPEQAASLAGRFGQIASLKAPRLTVKFGRLSLAYDRRLCRNTFKIVTDVRPVFDDDGSSVVGGFVSHTVQASVHVAPDGHLENVSFHADSNDLTAMLDEVRRALVKNDSAYVLFEHLRETVGGRDTDGN